MNENAARVDWAGAGVRVPRRFITPRVLRLAVERALGEPSIRERARELALWSGANDASERAVALLEAFVRDGARVGPSVERDACTLA
jgi:UDP:flavonoid glycosyltransferase YjiC (YdhE family)